MASQTDKQRILTGGLQLTPPGDKLDEGNSLICDNWRVDQQNELRTRFGSVKAAGPIGSGAFHSMYRSANDRYAGIGTSVFYGPALAEDILDGLDGNHFGMAFWQGKGWLMNPNAQKMIIGDQVHEWGVVAPAVAPVAAGGGQLTTPIEEFDGSDATVSVGIQSAPRGSGSANQFTEYAMQASVPVADANCTASFDSQNYQSGVASLKMVFANATGATAFTMTGGISTAVDGQIQDGDTFAFSIFCSNPAAVTKLSAYVRTGPANTPGSGYAEYNFADPSQFLNQALNSWTQLQIQRQLNVDAISQQIAAAAISGNQQAVTDLTSQLTTALNTPTFVYVGPGSGAPQSGLIGHRAGNPFPPSAPALAIDWNNITEFGISVQVNTACQVNVNGAEVIGIVNGNSTGAVNYFVSFVNLVGNDGNPSPASNPVIGGAQAITLTSIPISGSFDIKQRLIYRIGGGLSQAYQVGILYDNTTTTFVDTMSNITAQENNVVMPINRDPPPAAVGVLGPVFGKLICFNTSDHPARYFWNVSSQPWFFYGAGDDFVGNWEDAGQDDDGLLAATDHKQMVIFYKSRSIWRLAGDPATTDVVKTNSLVGLVGPNAIVSAGLLDYFVGWEGVYSFNGDFETKISQAIDPIFKGDYVQTADNEFLPPINVSAMATCSLAIIGDRLRVSYPEVGHTSPNVVAIYHTASGRWTREIYTHLAAPGFTAMLYEGPGFLMMAGATGSGGGYLYALEAQGFYLDDGQSAHATWQSRFFDQGLPDNFKIYTDLEIDLQTCSGQSPISTVSAYLVFDNGTKVLLGTLESAGAVKPRFTGILQVMNQDGVNVGYKAKNAAVRLESDFLGPIVVFGVYLHWYPEERVATSFDTGPTDFGIPERVKEVDYLEFYATGSGQSLQRAISSDLPGSLLAVRDDNTMVMPNGRGNIRYRLAAPIDGRNFRLWAGNNPSTATFQIHKARARMRPIGEYIDGTIGEYFESPEFSVGSSQSAQFQGSASGRVGQLKDLLLDYDSTAPAQLVIYTDLPGGALAVERSIPLPVQTRAIRVIPFEVPTLSAPGGPSTELPEGQLFKVRIIPAAGGIIRLHGQAVFRARVIGVYFDGTRNEIWETQPLDLFGEMGIFREVSIVTQSTGPTFLEVRTELPNQDMQTIASFQVNPSGTTAFRLPFTGRLPGSAKGRLQQLRLVGPQVARVFSCKLLGRRLQTDPTPWTWVNIPLEGTSDTWNAIQMPVRNTPEQFSWIEIPVDPIE